MGGEKSYAAAPWGFRKSWRHRFLTAALDDCYSAGFPNKIWLYGNSPFEMNFMHPPMVCWGQRTGQLTICATAKTKKDFLSPVCSNAHKMETRYMAGKQVGAGVQEIKQPDYIILSKLRWQCGWCELHGVQSYSIDVLFVSVRILIYLLITYERTCLWELIAEQPPSRWVGVFEGR